MEFSDSFDQALEDVGEDPSVIGAFLEFNPEAARALAMYAASLYHAADSEEHDETTAALNCRL